MTNPEPEFHSVFEPPIFLHHLTGGLMMLLGANRTGMFIAPGKDSPVSFSVPSNIAMSSLLSDQVPLRLLGTTMFHRAEDLQESVAQIFTIPVLDANGNCLADSQFLIWSGMGTALSRLKRNGEAMLVNRVRQQIQICLRRLERLSIAYRVSLEHAARTQAPSSPDSVRFTSDAYAQYLGSEYRSCINELYSLRDAILAAAFRVLFARTDPFALRKVKRLVGASSHGDTAKMIAHSMFDDGGDLLIDRMSLYRSIALHCLGATNPVIGDVYQLRVSTGPFGAIPYIVYPLYDDVARMRAIEQGSCKGIFDPPDKGEAQRFLGLASHQDALEFCFDCFVRLLRIGKKAADEIGITPEIVTLTDDEILEATVTKDRVTTHYRKDSTTGKLVER